MKTEKWVLATEIVSAVAVVATLAVLILEVQEGNRLARIATYQDITWQFNESRRDLLVDPELRELTLGLTTGNFPQQDTSEGLKLAVNLNNLFNVWDVAFLSYQSGVIGEAEWTRLERTLCPTVRVLPDDYREEQYIRITEAFVGYIESHC